jgi:hypothetical protein
LRSSRSDTELSLGERPPLAGLELVYGDESLAWKLFELKMAVKIRERTRQVGPLAVVARDLVEYFAAEFANPPPACLDDIKQRLPRKALFGNRRLRGESRRGPPLKPRFPGAIGKLGAGRNELPFRRLELHLHTAELAPDSICWQRGGGTWR